MKESRQARAVRDRKSHLSADAEKLVGGALGMANSGSRVEDRFWDAQLSGYLDSLLAHGHAQPIYDALERLHQTDHEAYGALIEAVEENAESLVIEHEGESWQVLLVCAPMVAWTRFHIPSGPLDKKTSQAITDIWQQVILVPQARFHLLPGMFSIDQLPRDYAGLRTLAHRLGTEAVTGKAPPVSERKIPESAAMLADTRFLVGAVAVPKGGAVFRWQAGESTVSKSPAAQGGQLTRMSSLEKWVEQVRPIATGLLPGCGFESLLPDAYHINMRESDRRVRPYGIRAAVHFLTHAVAVEASAVKAVVAAFGYERCDEYRIGLTIDPDGEELAHGIVWPLLGAESEADDPAPLDRIKELLGEAGLTDIVLWAGMTEPEYCEDCGAPLFPNDKGEVVHAELPVDIAPESANFH
ncbi:MAG: DUF2863 family protein [Burkholderiaceae bacterium]